MADPIIQRMLAEQAYGSIYSSQYADAAKSARANEAARRLGIPPDIVESAMPDMLAEERLRRRQVEIQRNQAYARIMANQRLAAAAIDDDELPKVAERADALRQPRHRRAGVATLPMNLAGAAAVNFMGGIVDTLGTGLAGFAQQVGENVGLESASSLGLPVQLRATASLLGLAGRTAAPALEQVSETLRPTTGNRNVDDVLGGFRSAGGTIGALGITVLTRNPWAGAGVMGAASSGQAYREGRAEGLDANTAGQYGLVQGAIELGTEYLGQRAFSNAIRGGRGMLQAVGLDIIAEIPGEMGATVGQELNRWYYIERPRGKSFSEYLNELPDELRSTVVATVTTAGLVGTGGYAIGREIDRRVDQAEGRRVDHLMESAAKSPTRTANPSDFEEALSQLVGDSEAENLYIPAEQVRALFQTDDQAIEEDAFWSAYVEQMAQAEALGGDVVVPLASAVTRLAGTPHWQQLRDHVRTRPGGMSIAEAKARETPEELERLAGEVAAQVESAVPRLQLGQAQAAVGKWAEGMGYSGEQAQAVNRFLASAAVRAYDADRQRRARFNRDPVSMGDFVAEWLPKALKARQDQFEGEELDRQRPRQERTKAAPKQTRATDVIQYVRQLGGIKDVEGHDLSKGRGFSKRPGLINNKRGLTIDEIGEALWEAQYFGPGAPRPTTADVLELLDRGFFNKVYAPTDVLGEAEAEREEDTDPELEKAGAEVYEAARAAGMSLTEAEIELAAVYRAEGMEVMAAIDRAFDETADRLFGLNQMFDEPAQPQRSMTAEQRAELEARQKQSMARRGGQQSVADQEGGLFSSERDQDSLFQLKRGNISITSDNEGLMRTALIRAFESANFSTTVHELGHFFLEDLRRRALGGQALEQEVADWQAFKDWAASLGHEVSNTAPIPVEAHEYFARGMERYVWEGQAPSNVLASLFYRMRDFMLEIYRTATAFNAPITPEIREVMDRMLASDAEIAERRNEMKLASDAARGLLSEAEQADYDRIAEEGRQNARGKLFERILSTLRRERGEEARSRKREIEADVIGQVDSLPVFRALKLLRSGIPNEDGTTAKVRLAREWLVDAYGEGVIDNIPKSVPPIFGNDDTMDADDIARLTGFESGDAMVTALLAHEQQRRNLKAQGDKRSPRVKLIADEVEARYRDEVGDPFENLEEEAEAALVNENQADLMSMELRALGRKSERRPTAWAMATEWARGHVRSQTTKQATTGASLQMYSRNAARAAREAEEALVKGDFDAAFQAKQRQLLNLALLQEAKRARDEVDKAVRRLQRIAGRETIPSVDQDYLEQAHQLLEDVDMKTRPATQVDKRKAFEDWHAEQVALGLEPVIPSRYQRILGKTNWTRLRIEELLELDAAVGQIIELGRLKQRLRDGQEQRAFEEGRDELVAVAEMQPARTGGKTTDPSRSLAGRTKSIVRSLDAAMLKAETFCRWMDGDNPNGPWTRLIFNIMAEAGNREADLRRTYIDDINNIIKGLPKKLVRSWDRLVHTPELVIRNPLHTNHGEPWQGTKDQVVIMALNWGNAGNRQRLLDGFGWEDAELLAVFERLMTKEDWGFVQQVWDSVDKLWPEIEALERRVNGIAPERVEATEIVTPHGTYRGGYFPAVYDTTQSVRAEMDEASRESPLGAWHQATTRSSATRARVERVIGRPLLLSMNVVTRHIGEVIHDITHREAVAQVRKILGDKQVNAVINSRMGPEYAKMMKGWLENIAQPGVAFSKSNPAGVMIGRWLYRGVSIVGLGLRVSTIAMQALGIPTVIGEIGQKRMAEGLATFSAHPVRTINEIQSRSAEMRSRWDTMDATIDEMVGAVRGGKLQIIGPTGIAKYAYHGIRYLDMAVTSAAWIGAFNRALAGEVPGQEAMSEDDAALYADMVVRTTQGSGAQKDRSDIFNQHPMVRLFYPFFSYLNALYNQQRDVGRRLRKGDVMEAGRRAWWMMVVPMLLQALIFGEGPDDDDEDGVDAADWARYLGVSAMLGNLGSLPFVGSIAQGIGSGYGYRSSAIQQVGEGIVRGAQKGAELATDEDEELTGATIKSMMNTIGVITGQPLGQPGGTVQGLYDYSRGEAQPEDAGDWYELLTKGRVSPEPTAIERVMGEDES